MINWFINLDYIYQALIATTFTYLITRLGASIVFFFISAITIGILQNNNILLFPSTIPNFRHKYSDVIRDILSNRLL